MLEADSCLPPPLLGLPVDQLGKQDISIWLTIVVGIVVGIVAALIGSAIVGPLRDTDGVDWVELIVQVALAALGVYLVASLRGRGRSTRHV